MTTITNYTEYTAAVNEAKLHDYRYFTLNAPTISDEQYDRLYFAIQDYETAHPEQTLPDSPTQSAHGEVKNGHKQIRRRTEMLSTEKAQTIEKVQKWMQKTTKKLAVVPCSCAASTYTVEWKYDGISLSLVYIDGQLTEASYGKGMEAHEVFAIVDAFWQMQQEHDIDLREWARDLLWWPAFLPQERREPQDAEAFGRELRETRQSLDITLQELAKRSGVDTGLISKIENGKVNPTLQNLLKIANAMGTDLVFEA